MGIQLASSQIGLTLAFQLVDPVGVNVGSPVSGAVTEIGSGSYMLDTSAIPDGFRGGIKFFSGATFKAFAAIAPEDIENQDAKVSTRLASASYTTPPTVGQIEAELASEHGDGAWDTSDILESADPLNNPVPGSYAPGSAGYLLGQITSFESLTSNAPVITESGDLELVKGQDYKEENAQAITFTSTTWPALGNASIWIEGTFTDEPIDMDIVQYGATQIVRLNLDDQATVNLPLNRYRYSVFARLSDGNVFVLATGRILFV